MKRETLLAWRSTDGGASFGSTVKLLSLNSPFPAAVLFPSIATSGNNVYVVWFQHPTQSPNAPEEIFLKRSINGGASFSFSSINLSLDSGGSLYPAIAASGNNVYVVWIDEDFSMPLVPLEILYRRSTNGGASFNSTVNLTNIDEFSYFPDIAASGNNVYVVWVDSTSETEILYRRSTNGGASFGSTVNLSNTAGYSYDPAIAAINK